MIILPFFTPITSAGQLQDLVDVSHTYTCILIFHAIKMSAIKTSHWLAGSHDQFNHFNFHVTITMDTGREGRELYLHKVNHMLEWCSTGEWYPEN